MFLEGKLRRIVGEKGRAKGKTGGEDGYLGIRRQMVLGLLVLFVAGGGILYGGRGARKSSLCGSSRPSRRIRRFMCVSF